MKLFFKECKGYIIIYYLGILITTLYSKLMNFISLGDIIYILLISTFILGCFLTYRYYKNKEVYKFFNNNIEILNQSFLDLGNSFWGENISKILKEQHNLYTLKIQEYKKLHNEHLTFINHWIHQMKTPISVINLQLQEYEYEDLSEGIKDEIDKINKGLNMAMYFARLDEFQKDFVVEKVNLNNLVISIVNEEKRLFIKNRVIPKVKIDKSIYVYTDIKWLKFIIYQLISNGVKYSRGHGNELNITSLENDRTIVLEVVDKGIGIVNKDIKRVFDLFFTGENGRKYGESTGMGLYIVNKVCENLGHKVNIESKTNKGTKVSIIFNR